jgi:hypothetical protein
MSSDRVGGCPADVFGLVSGKRAVDDALKATDFDDLDLLPADVSYRNMDLELDDVKKRTGRLDQLMSAVKTTTSFSSIARQRVAGVGERAARPTFCSCRSSRQPSPCAPMPS